MQKSKVEKEGHEDGGEGKCSVLGMNTEMYFLQN
jgi:hypothetical protein